MERELAEVRAASTEPLLYKAQAFTAARSGVEEVSVSERVERTDEVSPVAICARSWRTRAGS